MKKRILTFFLLLCLVFSMIPTSVFAADEEPISDNVINGVYNENGVWNAGGNGVLSYTANDGTSLVLGKTAKDMGNNKFEITLSVEAITKTSINKADTAATVIVVDVSNSMYSEGNRFTPAIDRLTPAKNAAKSFLESYAGDNADAERYVSVVVFGTTAMRLIGWSNVAGGKNENSYNAVLDAIDSIKIGFENPYPEDANYVYTDSGGTNLDAGVRLAGNIINMQEVSNIDYKNVIVLTDGVPTYRLSSTADKTSVKSLGVKLTSSTNRYGQTTYSVAADIAGDGNSGHVDNNNAAKNSADYVKKSADIYTICYGAKNTSTYSGGPNVGDFLKDSVASPTETVDGKQVVYAYNADNTAELNSVFAAITESITSGISGEGMTITDPMGNFINAKDISLDENTHIWELEDAVITENGQEKTYTYTITYTVELDTDVEGFDENIYYPANKVTLLNWDDNESFKFPVPGLKGVTSRFNVTYLPGEHGKISGTSEYKEIKKFSPVVTDDRPVPAVNPDEGYYFIGWDKDPYSAIVTGDMIFTARYASKSTVTVSGGTDSFSYNGKLRSITDYDVNGLKDGDILTNVSYLASGKNIGEYNGVFTNDEAKIIRDGKDVTGEYSINYLPGKLSITTKPLKITAASDRKTYDGTPLTNENYYSDGLTDADTITSVKVTGSQTEAGQSQNTAGDAVIMNGDEDVTANYIITYNPGELIVDKLANVTVTIIGNNDTKNYDGFEHTVTGYVAKSDNELYNVEKDITFTGVASVSRVNVGTTTMGLKADMFSNNNPNFEKVTFLILNDGYVTVDPIDVTVEIKGHTAAEIYDGSKKTVKGYDVSVNNALYKAEYFTFKGTDTVSGTTVGTYPMGLKAEDFANTNSNFKNVTFKVTDGWLMITPVDEVVVTIEGNSLEVPYDGNEHTVSGYTVSCNNALYDVTKDFTFNGNAAASRTNAGTTDMGLAAAQFANVNTNFKKVTFVVTDGYVTVDPIDVTVEIKGHTAAEIYDGSKKTVKGYDVSVNNALYKAEYFTFTGTDTVSGTTVGTYPMGLKAENFANTNPNFKNVTFKVTDGWLMITPVDEVVVNIEGNSLEVPYDGNEHTVSGYTVSCNNALYDVTKDFTFTGDASAARTNAGTTDMGLTAAQFANVNTNFKKVTFVVTDGYVTVDPIDVTVEIKGHTAAEIYDGSKKTVKGYDVSVNNALYKAEYFTFTGTDTVSGTTVGTYPMGLKAENFANTNPNFKNVTFKVTDGWLMITPVDEVVVTIEGNSLEVPYDGNEHTVSGYTVSCNNALYDVTKDFTFTGDASAARTNAGTTDMGLTAAQFANVNTNFKKVTFVVTDGYVTVDPIDVTVEIKGHTAAEIYDGSKKTVKGYDVSVNNALYKAEYFTFTGTDTVSGTTVGTYPMGLKAENFANTNQNFKNVTFKVTDGWLMITPVDEVVVTIEGNSLEVPYDGNEHTVSGYTVSCNNALYDVTKDFTFTGDASAARTNAGTTDMGLTAAQFANVNTNFKKVTFVVTDGYVTVDPIDVTVEIKGHTAAEIYDGSKKTVKGYDVSVNNELYKAEYFTFKGTDTVSGTTVGTYPMGLKAEDFANTNQNFKNVTFKVTDGWLMITPVDEVVVTIEGNTLEVPYDGNEHTVSGYTVSCNNALYDVTKDFTFTGEATASLTFVGREDMGITAEQFSNNNNNFINVKFNVIDGWICITPIQAGIVITAASDSKEYDGTPLTNSNYTFTDSILIEGDELIAVVEGTIQDAGVSANVVTNYKVMHGDTDVTDCYTFEDAVDGILEITKRKVVLTSASDSKFYDSKPLTNTNVTAQGFAEGEGAIYEVTGSQTEIGTSENTFNYVLNENTKSENYDIIVENGTLTVLPSLVAKTGDNSFVNTWFALMLISLAVFFGTYFLYKKRAKVQ